MLYVKKVSDNGTCRIVFSGQITSPDDWKQMYDAVTEEFPSYESVELDCGNVERATPNCGAILLRGISMARSYGVDLIITRMSDSLRNVLDVCRIGKLIKRYIKEPVMEGESVSEAMQTYPAIEPSSPA